MTHRITHGLCTTNTGCGADGVFHEVDPGVGERVAGISRSLTADDAVGDA